MTDVLNESIYPSTLTTLAFYIAVLHPENNVCKVLNTLILDHVTDGYIIQNKVNSPVLDDFYLGENFKLGQAGVYRSINAVKEDRLLAFELTKGNTKNNIGECEDSPYGFKLSEIIKRVGNPLDVQADQTGHITSANIDGWNDLARLKVYQNGYCIEKDNKTYFFFDFTITNIGSKNARQVTFKDVIPVGLKLLQNTIKIDGKNTDSDVLGRRLLVNLPNITPLETIHLTFICLMESKSCVYQINIGCIVYITWHAIKDETCTKTIIITQISNIKSIDKFFSGFEVLNE